MRLDVRDDSLLGVTPVFKEADFVTAILHEMIEQTDDKLPRVSIPIDETRPVQADDRHAHRKRRVEWEETLGAEAEIEIHDALDPFQVPRLTGQIVDRFQRDQ